MRREIIKALAEGKSHKTCFRYACCGLGDQLTQRGDEVFVSPKGCGHKLCPRCGRRRGGKYAKRIIGHLAERPHGDLWQMVLTQPVIEGEGVDAARKRMAKKHRSYCKWLDKSGSTAGMSAVHIVWSTRSNGWHYHVHLLIEAPTATFNKQMLLDRWHVDSAGEKCRTGDEQCRLVVSAGPAIDELKEDSGDADFWQESKGPVARAVQYPLRDLVQGVSAWRLGGDVSRMAECARELVRKASGWKCFRAWGSWRKAVEIPEEKEADAEDGIDPSPGTPGAPISLGGVGAVWRSARGGSEVARLALRKLEASVRNDSDFAKRLIKYCRSAMLDRSASKVWECSA